LRSFSWTEHLGLIVGGGVTLLVAVRFLSISTFDANTASAVLQAIGPANALVGTVISGASLALAYAIGGAVGIAAYQKLALNQPYGRHMVLVTLCGFTFLLMFMPVIMTGISVLIALTGPFFAWMDGREGADAALAASANRRFMASMAIGVFLSGFLVNTSPWLPTENITPGQGDPFVGFVLRDDGGRVIALTRDERLVRYLSGPVDRQVCGSRAWWSVSGAQILRADDQGYPDCAS
jgi:hypothetical protein